jgi:hypothetical protein
LEKLAWKCLAQPARNRLLTKTPSSDPISNADIIVAVALWKIYKSAKFFQQCGDSVKKLESITLSRLYNRVQKDLRRISELTELSCENYLKFPFLSADERPMLVKRPSSQPLITSPSPNPTFNTISPTPTSTFNTQTTTNKMMTPQNLTDSINSTSQPLAYYCHCRYNYNDIQPLCSLQLLA